MKNYFTNIAVQLVLGATAICATGSQLQAQSSGAIYKIPFAFHAADRDLSAGTYKVWHPSTPNVEFIQPTERGSQLAIGSGQMVMTDSRTGKTRLTFRRYGNEFYLTQVWTGEGTGMKLTVTAAEKKAREQVAQIKSEEVVIYASLR